MATFFKKDIQGTFYLLGIVYLFDSLASNYAVGILIAILILGLAWISGDAKSSKSLVKSFGKASTELVLRGSVAIVLLGVLLFNLILVAIGILAGEILLFSRRKSISFTLPLFEARKSR